MFVIKFKKTIQKLSKIFNQVSSSSELKLDAFIFSKNQLPQIRALVFGTGVYITLPLSQVGEDDNFISRFGKDDVDVIHCVIRDSTDLCSHLIDGKKIEIIAKTYDRLTKKISLKLAIINSENKHIEFEVDPAELSRNKFMLQLFSKHDAFNIGYSAAESRIRTEKNEIRNLKVI